MLTVPRFLSLSSAEVAQQVNLQTRGCNKRKIMNEVLLLIVIVVGWYVLNRFVLPHFGVRT